jgi:hypothetical protein
MPELEHQNEKLTQDLSLSLARQHNQKIVLMMSNLSS